MPLPTDPVDRKEVPVYSGVLKYFPDAIAEIARLSQIGNDQHNPGTALHWDRAKSGDELDALARHLLEAGTVDADGVRHSTKLAWRALANLQKELEQAQIGKLVIMAEEELESAARPDRHQMMEEMSDAAEEPEFQPDWDEAPDWARWWAVDQRDDGALAAGWFEERPALLPESGLSAFWSYAPGGPAYRAAPGFGYDGSGETSLRRRPTSDPKEDEQ